MMDRRIVQISLHSPVVNKLLTMHKLGQITEHEAMAEMIVALYNQNGNLFERVIKLEQSKCVPASFVVPPNTLIT
jgi:hypothetical protein